MEETTQLDRLERRVERLTSVIIIQSVLLAAVVLMNVMEIGTYAALFVLVALPLLVFYRKQLPAAARWLGQTVRRWKGTAGAVPSATVAKSPEEQST
jgi:uncharacterized membrane protein YobD (UPF0266 family)